MYGLEAGKYIDSVEAFCRNNGIDYSSYGYDDLLFENKADRDKSAQFLERLTHFNKGDRYED